ncbi:hypothetical protein [Halomonas korlensis]|uniref:Phage tail tape measure protein, TP901 family, core region n=1 Tax=Halomonas korlensis TaxID=463301 RepID=A0A1I7J455_9GAMM|nr:hypothetical protein [Halomonas korlensis]SFU79953.1 hypothetical protein SAMN04487955_10948 [Halomonas korlensis]
MAKDLNLSVTLKAINQATGPLKKILQGSRGVGRAMRESREELKGFNDQQKRISAFRDMTRKSLDTRNALREKRQELDRVTQEIKTATGPTKRLTNQQAKAQAAVDKLNAEYRDQRDRVLELSRNLPKAEDGTRGLTAQQQALDRQIRATNERINRQRNALQRLSDADVSGRFRNMTGEVGRFGRRAVFATGAAAGSIFGLANSTADLGDDVGKTAAKLGLTNAELQEFRYAGERSGVATKTMDSSLLAFTKRLGEAADGTGAAVKGYEALGLNAEKLADMPVAAAMREVADRMAEIENPTRRNAIAAQLYSRAGVGLVNVLKDGSAGLDEYNRAARQTGYMLGDEATAGSESFKDALLDTGLSLKGIKNTIGAELMPGVEDMMRDLSGWLAENRDQVKQFAKSFGDNLKAAVPIITDLAKGTARLATGIGEVVSKLAGMVGGYDNLAMIAGGLFASKALLSMLTFGASLVKAGGALLAFAKTLPVATGAIKALGLAFAATPIGWIVAGIAAVAGVAYLLYENWDWIGPWFSELWDGIKASGAKFWVWFKQAPGAAIEAVGSMLTDWDLKGAIKEKWDAAIGYLKGLPGRMKDAGVDVAKGLGEGIKNGAGNAWGAVKDFANGTENVARYELDTHSPSKVFARIGGDVTDGLALGIRRNQDGPANETRAMVSRLRQAGGGLMLGAALTAGGAASADPLGSPRFDARAPLSAPATGGSTLNGGINITINAAPGMDEQALAQRVASEVQRAMAGAQRDAEARQRSAFFDLD